MRGIPLSSGTTLSQTQPSRRSARVWILSASVESRSAQSVNARFNLRRVRLFALSARQSAFAPLLLRGRGDIHVEVWPLSWPRHARWRDRDILRALRPPLG